MEEVVTRCRAAVALLAAWVVLAGCGGSDVLGGDPVPLPDPLPPAGASRWAALDVDHEADGTVDEITLYAYDDADRRSAATTYRAVAGAAAGDPLKETRWTYDTLGRVTGITLREVVAGRETATTLAYGPDGRLGSRRDVVSPGTAVTETRFGWREGRVVEATRTGPAPAQFLLTYGDDGFVGTVLLTGTRGDVTEARYRWRSDGRLMSAIVAFEIVLSYTLAYDADGRHVGTRVTDDGLETVAVRLGHDAQARVTEVAYDDLPDPDPAVFVARRLERYRWEAARCQPVVMPVVPPYREQIEAGLISPTNVSFGCGP